MSVSANTLFHFTDKNENLKSILKNSFYPKYSLEDLSNATPPMSNFHFAHIPMVCFCDLLFSQIKSHIDFYGDYGIGLSKKEWGIKKGISPIFYFPQESISSKLLSSVATEINRNINTPTERKIILGQLQNFYKYVKPYSGKSFNRKTSKLEKKIYYDEREWRFVPSRIQLLPDTDAVREIIDSENKKMELNHKLAFKARQIRYIIVKKENEIPDFVDFIERDLIREFNESDRKLLASKLISVEQIKEDM